MGALVEIRRGSPSDRPVASREARDRTILIVGAFVYLAWWFSVEQLLPGSYNPLGGRLVVVAALLALGLVGSRVAWIARHHSAWFCGAMVLLTLHYHWLFLHNLDLVNWIIGAYITVLAVGATFSSLPALRVYLVAALAMAVTIYVLRPELHGTVFLPGLVTILLVQELSQRARIQLTESVTRSRLEKESAERLASEKTHFLNLVSHELVTPLQAIELTVESMRRKSDADERSLTRLGRSAERLSGLIRSLLEYARLGRESVEPSLRELNLSELVSATVEDLRVQAEAKQLELRVELEPGLTPIRSDSRFLRIMLVNVIGNAIKYTEQGSVVVRVARAPGSDGQQVSVTDTGPGIPEALRGRIFDSFVQLEPLEHKHVPGVGLGLAIVRDLAERLGARLEVSSAPERGSTFLLRICPAGRPVELASSS